MVMMEIPNRSLEMIIATSFPGYDSRMSEATSRPKVMKPYTPEGDMINTFQVSTPPNRTDATRWTHLWGCRRANRKAWRAQRWTPSGGAAGSACCCRSLCRLHGTATHTHTHMFWRELPETSACFRRILNDKNLFLSYDMVFLKYVSKYFFKYCICKNRNILL